MAAQEFQFRYLMYSCSAVIDEVYLTVKQGVRTRQVELHRLRHFYVHVVPSSGIECLIGYETQEGKKKVMRFNANLGDPGFAAFAEALGKAKPEIDIRSLDAKAAHKLMGAVSIRSLVPIIVFGLSAVVMAVIFLPALIHGLDSGSAVIDAAACAGTCDTASRNVTLTNGYVHDEYMSEQEGKRDVNHYLLYVPGGWEKADPVYLVIKTPGYDEDRLEDLAAREEISGVLRNVLWEGLDDDWRAEFKKEWNITIAPEARLVEYAADPQVEFTLVLAVIGILLSVTLILSVVAVVRRR